LEQARQDGSGGTGDDVSEGCGVLGRFGADVDCAGGVLSGPVDEVGGGIDGAGGAYDEHERGLIDLTLDAVHVEWNFSEEDDVRAQESAAGAATNVGDDAVDGVVFYGWAAATVFAAGLR
jgi:hypothetical protein